MHSIYGTYGRSDSEPFQESLAMLTAIFPEIVNVLLLQQTA